jgi:hypothetical protein
MSTEPVGLGKNAVEATKEHWVNIEITKEMYCSYSGDCSIHRVIQGMEDTCIWCIYRVGIDMPQLIKERIKDD